jgi:sulfatase modifying factor 1
MILGCMLIIAAASILYDPGKYSLYRGNLNIVTNPNGANVLLDGREVGQSPLQLDSLPAGQKILSLTHPYHGKELRTISVESGETTFVDVNFEQVLGSLNIFSNPNGAQVVLDNAPLDEVTPINLTGIATGKHTLVVSLQRYGTFESTVEVFPNRVAEPVIELQPVPWGTLTVKMYPADASLSFVGQDVSYTPGMGLPVGDYLVDVSRTNYLSVSKRIKVSPGANAQQVKLERRMVPLRVSTIPASAEITIEYTVDGIARMRPYGDRISAPMGLIAIVVRAPGYRTTRKRIRLGTRGLTTSIKLEKFDFTPGREFKDALSQGGVAPLVKVIGPGEFQMGDLSGTGAMDEQPVHKVVLTQPFAIGVYEVTVAEYMQFINASKSEYKPGRVSFDNHPAVNISLDDALAYLAWLSKQSSYHYRLPTEAEWEFIARAGIETSFPDGNSPDHLCQFANIADQATKKRFNGWDVADCDDGYQITAPVGQFKPNAFGLYDILGNVSEWVSDCWFYNYENAHKDGRARTAEDERCSRVVRGGSWDSHPSAARLSYRESSYRGNDDRGLRVVREL